MQKHWRKTPTENETHTERPLRQIFLPLISLNVAPSYPLGGKQNW